jgi:hypothetical protein
VVDSSKAIVVYGSIRFYLLFSTVQAVALYPVPMKSYSKQTNPQLSVCKGSSHPVYTSTVIVSHFLIGIHVNRVRLHSCVSFVIIKVSL